MARNVGSGVPRPPVSERLYRQTGDGNRVGLLHAGAIREADPLARGPGADLGKVSRGGEGAGGVRAAFCEGLQLRAVEHQVVPERARVGQTATGQAGISYEALDNGFLSCEQPTKLQEICDSLGLEDIDRVFRKWLSRIPLPLASARPTGGL